MMSKRPRLLLVSAEAYPFTGSGAGETMLPSIPEAVAREGFDVSLILPKYRRPAIEALECEPVVERLPVPLGENKVPTTVYRAEAAVAPCVPIDSVVDPEAPRRRFPVYLIENAKYFDRERIFGSTAAPYLDNDERFVFFCRAVMEFIRKTGIGADLIHCHDWPTALIPLFLRTGFDDQRPFKKTVTFLTVHDLAAQGEFPPESFALTGLSWDLFHPDKLAVNGRFNFLNAGFRYADGLSAGNEAAAEEIRNGEAGAMLRAVLEKRRREEDGRETAAAKKKKARPAGKAEAQPDGRLELAVPASAREYAGFYRRAMQKTRGGSDV